MSRKKVGLLILIFFLVAIQFFQAARNETRKVLAVDFNKAYIMPDSIQVLLQNSCFDCHSNNTRYPWYSNIQPFGWWLAHHIKEGKSELNFSEFGDYSTRRQKSKLKAIKDALEDNSMPLSSYTLIHTKAKLSKVDKASIISWIDKIENSLQQH